MSDCSSLFPLKSVALSVDRTTGARAQPRKYSAKPGSIRPGLIAGDSTNAKTNSNRRPRDLTRASERSRRPASAERDFLFADAATARKKRSQDVDSRSPKIRRLRRSSSVRQRPGEQDASGVRSRNLENSRRTSCESVFYDRFLIPPGRRPGSFERHEKLRRSVPDEN